jgi:hypothetical protein
MIMDKKPNNTESQSQDKTINLSFALTRNDLLWYNLYFIRWIVYGAMLLILLFIGGLIWSVSMPQGDLQTAMIWMVIALAAGFSICMGSIMAVVLQIFFTKSEIVAKSMTRRNYIVSSTGVAVYDERGQIMRPWAQVKNIIKTKHRFYIRTGDKMSIILPKREFKSPDDLQAFEGIISHYKP